MHLFRILFILFLFCLTSRTASAFQEVDSIAYYDHLLQQTEDEKARMKILLNLASCCWSGGAFEKGTTFGEEAVKIAEKRNDSLSMGDAYGYLGSICASEGNMSKALDYFIKAEKCVAKDPDRLAGLYLFKGNLFSSSGDWVQARKYYLKSASLSHQVGNVKRQISAVANIGGSYKQLNKPDSALLYFFKALHLSAAFSDSCTYGMICMAIGDSYITLDQKEESKKFAMISLRLAGKCNMKENLPYIYYNLASIEYGLKEFRPAKAHLGKAMIPSECTINIQNLMSFYGFFKTLDSALGLKDSAIWDQHKYIALSDSAHNKQLSQSFAEMQSKFDAEKRDGVISLLNKDKDLEAEKLKRQKFVTGLIVGGLLVFGCLSVFLYRNYKAKVRTNHLLEVQKNEIERNRKLLAARNEKIEDSILYAKRIQEAILPAELFTSSEVKDQFVYFMPKDIVSGDFYWRYRDGDDLFFAVVDCTGHGVPGAMMSMLGYDMLEYALVDRKLREPADILTAVNMQIIEKLYTSNPDGAKDGMDMTLCRLNLKSRVMTYSGAKNDVLLVSGNELQILPVDKNSIGFSADATFTQSSVSLKKDDKVYLFSDGYGDQNGEMTKKKYMSARFRSLLLSIAGLSFAEQKEKLHAELMEWKGNLQQRDDILVAGLKCM
jgi:serine phosphatase RsbU (regulator of sigma subunit)